MRILFTFVVLGGLVVSLNGQTASAPVVRIHAGPVYTRGDEAGVYPKYPDLQIQMEVPPNTSSDLVKPEAFSVRADNGSTANATREQTLASAGYGLAASVAIDVSGSMKGAPLDAVRTGLGKFVSDAGPQDKIAIQTIADESRWEVNWDSSRDQVKNALDKLEPRGSLTRLWDGLLDAVLHFPATPLCQRIIVISDGHDEGSRHTEAELIIAAHQRGILIDAIGITRSNPQYLQALAQLATQTGGQFREAKDNNELDQLVSSGIERLKSTPVVSFRLGDLPADGNNHRLQVIWKHEGLTSRAEVLATLPPAPPWFKTRLFWGVGGAAVLLLLLVVVIVSRQRPVDPKYTGMPVVEPIIQTRPPEPILVKPLPVKIDSVPQPAPPLRTDTVGEKPVRARSKTEIIAKFPVPTKENPAAWLLCEKGFAPGEKFPLNEVEYWIGALENNNLHIADDPTVSGHHACLVFDHEVLGIYDHQSTNGTRVNGDPVHETRRLLRPGDRIQVGESIFAIQPVEREGVNV